MLSATKTVLVSHLGGIEVGFRTSTAVLDNTKPTLVMFNPFTTTTDYYTPEFESEALTTVVNLVAIEPLGHGHTRAVKTDSFTYWDSAIISFQLLDILGIDEVFALGTSQGGWIAARMAILAPERVGISRNSSFWILLIVFVTDPGHHTHWVINGCRIRKKSRCWLLGWPLSLCWSFESCWWFITCWQFRTRRCLLWISYGHRIWEDSPPKNKGVLGKGDTQELLWRSGQEKDLHGRCKSCRSRWVTWTVGIC